MRVGIGSMCRSPAVATHPDREGGADVTAEITVGFDEAAFGCEKVIHLTENNGKTVGKALKVKIPAGIDTGKSIRLRGKGNPGINGGKAGDLLLWIIMGGRTYATHCSYCVPINWRRITSTIARDIKKPLR